MEGHGGLSLVRALTRFPISAGEGEAGTELGCVSKRRTCHVNINDSVDLASARERDEQRLTRATDMTPYIIVYKMQAPLKLPGCYLLNYTQIRSGPERFAKPMRQCETNTAPTAAELVSVRLTRANSACQAS